MQKHLLLLLLSFLAFYTLSASACTVDGDCDHGYCINGTCACKVSWKGADCDTAISCSSGSSTPNVTCGHGFCVPNTTNCLCHPGWIGTTCDVSECNGRGIYYTRLASCICIDGYTGTYCDECAKGPADVLANGTMVPSAQTYLCCSMDTTPDVNSTYALVAVNDEDVDNYLDSENVHCVVPGNVTLDCACRRDGQDDDTLDAAFSFDTAVDEVDVLLEYFASILYTQKIHFRALANEYANAAEGFFVPPDNTDTGFGAPPPTSEPSEPNHKNNTGYTVLIVFCVIAGVGVLIVAVYVIYIATRHDSTLLATPASFSEFRGEEMQSGLEHNYAQVSNNLFGATKRRV